MLRRTASQLRALRIAGVGSRVAPRGGFRSVAKVSTVMAIIATLCATEVTAADAASKQLDQRGYLALGGRADVFTAYPSQPFVYLLKEFRIQVMGDKSRIGIRDVIAVTSSEGRDQGTRLITLPEKFKLRNLTCVHVTPSGGVIPAKEADIRKKPVGGWVEYTVALPQVQPGSIIDIGYEYEIDYSVSYEEFQPAARVPVLHARLVAGCDDLIAMQVLKRNCPKELRMTERVDGDPQRDAGTYQYDFFDLKPISREAMAPPARTCQPLAIVYVSGRKNWERTTSDESPIWKAVNERRNWNYAAFWDEPYLRAACNLEESGEAQKIVKSLTKECRTSNAKLAAVLQFVRNNIHVLEDGVGRSYPMPATETLESRSGNASDAAGVAIGMLRLAGIDVKLGLARRRSAGEWDAMTFSSDQFDRFLAWVPGDEGDTGSIRPAASAASTISTGICAERMPSSSRATSAGTWTVSSPRRRTRTRRTSGFRRS